MKNFIFIFFMVFFSSLIRAHEKIDTIITDAHHFFKAITPTINSLVIFDIDDTSLDTSLQSGQCIILQGGMFLYFHPIPQVLLFYKDLIARGFKTVFLTARVEKSLSSCRENDVLEQTKKNLITAGYTQFEDVICRTFQDSRTMKIHAWKEKKRKELSLKYTIHATLDDDSRNLTGECTGKKIQMPSQKLGGFYLRPHVFKARKKATKLMNATQ